MWTIFLLVIKRRKNRGYTYLCAGSVICVSLLRAPQYSTFACCLIPVLTLVVLLVMLDDIDDISFSKRRYFLIVSWMSISVYGIPTRDTHITRDMCTGIHISRGYTCHCDTWSGSAIRDHLDHGRSNEPMNPCPEWSHRFIWHTLIWVISDRWSWSGSCQRNAKGKTQKVSKD